VFWSLYKQELMLRVKGWAGPDVCRVPECFVILVQVVSRYYQNVDKLPSDTRISGVVQVARDIQVVVHSSTVITSTSLLWPPQHDFAGALPHCLRIPAASIRTVCLQQKRSNHCQELCRVLAENRVIVGVTLEILHKFFLNYLQMNASHLTPHTSHLTLQNSLLTPYTPYPTHHIPHP
jgi:hypothetical protein